MITYNHEAYIRRAVESVFSQLTDFDVELVVGEDCSTDRTRDILLASTNGKANVKLLLHDSNLGVRENARRTLAACTGEFVASLEGDDYWTDTGKLAHQVAVLRAEPHLSAVAHGAKLVDCNDHVIGQQPEPAHYREQLDAELLASENPVPSASLLFRRELLPEIPSWTNGLMMLDWPILISLAQHGPIRVEPQIWSAYRIHAQGIWTSAQERTKLEAIVEFYDRIGRQFPLSNNTEMPTRRKAAIQRLFALACASGDRATARRWLWRFLLSAPGRGRLPPNHSRYVASLLPLCGALFGTRRQ